jgi:hypothetical protein
MAEHGATFPRYYFHTSGESRPFETEHDLASAGPGWYATPQDAAEAAAPATPEPPLAPPPPAGGRGGAPRPTSRR